jgi:hypothetical protein
VPVLQDGSSYFPINKQFYVCPIQYTLTLHSQRKPKVQNNETVKEDNQLNKKMGKILENIFNTTTKSDLKMK